jgi:hypothetical protein
MMSDLAGNANIDRNGRGSGVGCIICSVWKDMELINFGVTGVNGDVKYTYINKFRLIAYRLGAMDGKSFRLQV